jgi:hypothetical protein
MKSVIAIDGAPKELGDLWRKRADAIVESNR